jgi:hypothetical protein
MEAPENFSGDLLVNSESEAFDVLDGPMQPPNPWVYCLKQKGIGGMVTHSLDPWPDDLHSILAPVPGTRGSVYHDVDKVEAWGVFEAHETRVTPIRYRKLDPHDEHGPDNRECQIWACAGKPEKGDWKDVPRKPNDTPQPPANF